MKFSEEDIEQLKTKGISTKQVEEQLQIFKKGNIPVDIENAATVDFGILQFSDFERGELSSFYDEEKNDLDIIKFVPASGAATRMFKALHEFFDDFDSGSESLVDYLNNTSNSALKLFFDQLEKLPFYKKALSVSRQNQPGIISLNEEAQKFNLVQTILFSPGLDLSNYPKGLVPFHDYKEFVATAFEEHLYDAAAYIEVNGVAKLHFTVSQGHRKKFQAEFDQIKARVEERTNTKFEITYSYQNPGTDTIAVEENNEPFRTNDGKLFFRPGGHGALIDNLNNLVADLVFIKNIDNVVLHEHIEEVAQYKKMLGGKLLQLQSRAFSYLQEFENNIPSTTSLEEIKTFIEKELYFLFPPGIENLPAEQQWEKFRNRLDSPLRVCGMVKNEGEPGGGPFLVKKEDGSKSLQIIEGAQINQEDTRQRELALNATHFNPVDIVCGLKNYQGKAFDLNQYVDPNTSFIANKSKDGKALKALELPGLWNGAMANWNTVFIEVPVSTFNPVKTVTDLLKPSHQAT